MNGKMLDKVNMAYKGEFGEKMKNATRARLNWICENAHGKKILDVGSSQGITSILLARSGKYVKGIDIEEEQVKYAFKELSAENEETQRRVNFICGDFLTYDFKGEKFDTIIMGECLEHVFNPKLFLAKAKDLINDDGYLVVTVPFGVNLAPDHKRTYYFLGIYNQVNEQIHVDSVRFFGKWVGLVANKNLKNSKIIIDDNLIAMIEHAFFSIDENNNSIISSQNSRLKDLMKINEELAEKERDLIILKEKLNEVNKLNSETENKFREMNNVAYSVKKSNEMLQHETEVQKEQLKNIEKLVAEKEAEIFEFSNENTRLKRHIDSLLQQKETYENQIESNRKTILEKEEILLRIIEEKQNFEIVNSKLTENVRELEGKVEQLLNESNLWQNKFKEMNDVAYSGKKKAKAFISQNEELNDKYILYKNAYEALFSLRGIKAWLKVRKMMGKPYDIITEKIGETKLEEKEKKKVIENKNIIIKAKDKRKRYEELSLNKKFYESIEEITKKIKESNGSGYYKKGDFRVGIITDEFMFNYYKDSLNLTYISPDNYKDIIDNKEIEFLLFVSCWHGMYGREDYSGDAKRTVIVEIFEYAKANGIPVVFQTIEDPTNYNLFFKVANAADYIFTSDMSMIDKYKKETGNENVFYLGYGINPQFHNPIGSFLRRRIYDYNYKVFFAGSWTDRYPNRCKDIEMLFDGVINSKRYELIVADRNMDIDGYAYPEKYAKYLMPPIRHDLLQKVHKLFDFTLNINTITDSPTMCAMRVYEVQALGSLLISNYSLASSNTFPGIFNIILPEEVNKILNGYSKENIIAMELNGIRDVFSNYTVYDRLNYIFEKIGIRYRYKDKTVFVLYDKLTNNIVESFNRQSYAKKELYSVKDFLQLKLKDGYFIILKDNIYSDNYILDLINATKYTDTEYVIYCDYTDTEMAFEYISKKNTREETLYDISKINISNIVKEEYMLENGFAVPYLTLGEKTQSVEKELAVIIPVYNNGKYLRDRAIRSLQRSSIFDAMQIYIIDDGSTDEETHNYIHEIAQEFNNITTFFFDDKGSGSASRPRNMGVEISKEKYITYLDPDNEAINDGYALLLNDIKAKKVDFAFGDIIKIGNTINPLCFEYEDKLIETPREELVAKKFRTNSIQACVIKRELIENNNIKNPEGAIGQDTMFFYELMLNSKRVYHRYIPIHIYYAQRFSSVVNDIGKNFFNKSYIMEKYQAEALKRYNLLEEYKTTKFEQFFNDWYLEKLKLVNEEDEIECKNITESIFNLYN